MFRLIRVAGFALTFGSMLILFPVGSRNYQDFHEFVFSMFLGITMIVLTETGISFRINEMFGKVKP